MLLEMILSYIACFIQTAFFGLMSFVFGFYTITMWNDHEGHEQWFSVCIVLTIVALYMTFSRMVLVNRDIKRRLDALQASAERRETVVLRMERRRIEHERRMDELSRTPSRCDPAMEAAFDILTKDIYDRASESVWGGGRTRTRSEGM